MAARKRAGNRKRTAKSLFAGVLSGGGGRARGVGKSIEERDAINRELFTRPGLPWWIVEDALRKRGLKRDEAWKLTEADITDAKKGRRGKKGLH